MIDKSDWFDNSKKTTQSQLLVSMLILMLFVSV